MGQGKGKGKSDKGKGKGKGNRNTGKGKNEHAVWREVRPATSGIAVVPPHTPPPEATSKSNIAC